MYASREFNGFKDAIHQKPFQGITKDNWYLLDSDGDGVKPMLKPQKTQVT